MTTPKMTWMEKRLSQEEKGDNEGTGSDSGNDGIIVNMVFELPTEFCVLETEVAKLALGVKAVVFQKPEKIGGHMRPLFIRGHLQGQLVHRIMVDGGTRVNVMTLSTFERMKYHKDELMRTNTSLSAFTGEVTEARGVLSVELTVGSKTLATTFFMVDVNG
jgi:hypothetical protein